MSEMDESTPLDLGSSSRIWLTFVGLVQGLGFYLLFEIAEDSWKTSAGLMFACGVFLATAAPLFQLTYGIGKLPKIVTVSFVAPLILALLWLWSHTRLAFDETGAIDGGQAWWFILSVGLAIHILLPFTQTYFEEGRLRFPYPSLFRFSWNNALIVAASLVFLGVFWLVLLLWAGLFSLVDIDFFGDLFQEPLFAWVFTGAAFGLGIAMVRENARILLALRRIVLVLFRILSPVLAIVGLMFLIVLPFTGLEPLWGTSSATPILIGLAFWSVVFVNAVIQDGENSALFPTPVNWVIAVHLVTLPVFAGLAFYALSLRVDQYGLTPERFAAQLIVILAGLQVLAYAVAVIRFPNNWIASATRANPAMAVIIAVVALTVHTPLLDAYSRSAADQLDRFSSGKAEVEGYDYGFLKFKLGAPGREALQEIAALAKEHPQVDVIEARLAALAEAADHWQWTNELFQDDRAIDDRSGFMDNLLRRPEAIEIPAQVVDIIVRNRRHEVTQCAKRDAKCVLRQLDADGDGRNEYLYSSSGSFNRPLFIFELKDGDGWAWSQAEPEGESGNRSSKKFDYEAAFDAILSGDYELVEPVYPDIRVGTQRLRF